MEKFWLRLVVCGVAGIFAAAPTLLWTLATVAQPSKPIDFRTFLLEYYPFHTFVHVQWGAAVRYAAYLVAAGFAAVAAARALGGRRARIMLALLTTYGAVFLLGVPLPYLTGSRLLLNLYPLRIDAVVNLAVAVFALAWAARSLHDSRERDTLPLVVALCLLIGNAVAALPMLGLLSLREGKRGEAVAIGVALAGIMFLLVAGPQLQHARSGEFAPLTLLFCLLAVGAAAADGKTKHRLPAVALLTAVLISSFRPFEADWLNLPAAAVLAVAGALLSLHFLPFDRLAARAVAPAPILGGLAIVGLALSGYSGWRGSVSRPDADLEPDREAQLWVRHHTPPDTMLLEAGVTGFSLLSRRPVWVDAQAGAAVLWKPDFLNEWKPRMDAVRACRDAPCYAALARRERIGWIVANRGALAGADRAGLTLLFSNRRYDIFSVQTTG